MNAVFLLLFATHIAHALIRNRESSDADVDALPRGAPVPSMPYILFGAAFVFGSDTFVRGIDTLGEKTVISLLFAAPAASLTAAAALLALLAATALFARPERLTARMARRGMALLESLLFVAACYVAFHQGALSRELLAPHYILLGLVGGHLLYGASLVLTQHNLHALRDYAEHFLDLRAVGRFARENPRALFGCLDGSIGEEVIYRAACQAVLIQSLGSPVTAIILVAFAFSITHGHYFRNALTASIEFTLFAVLLGALYYVTGSLILTILIHAVRNFDIVYLDFLLKKEALGDETQAQRAVEAAYMHQHTEHS
jgi:membrane protease YdiL (CAAX protease family)